MIGGSWVVLAIVLLAVVPCALPPPFTLYLRFFVALMRRSIVLVLLLVWSLPCFVAAARLLLLFRARLDGGQTMRCP